MVFAFGLSPRSCRPVNKIAETRGNALDGKEEVVVVEAQPGSVSAVASLESLDVLDKVPDSVATPLVFTMER